MAFNNSTVRVRLAHQTFLLLLATVLIAVAAMGLLFALNLEHGFVAYVNARQIEQLDTLQRLLARESEATGSLEHMRGDRRLWHSLLQRASPDIDGGRPLPPPKKGGRGPRGEVPWEEFPGGFDPGKKGRPYAPRPPPPDGLFGLGPRVELLDASRVPFFAEPPPPPNADEPVERAIEAGGRVVAWLRLWPLHHVDRPEDIAFLRSQYHRIGWVAASLIVLVLIAAPLVARRWTRPLSEIASATARIARGEFGVRLDSKRRDEIGTLMHNVDTMAQSLSQLERARRRWMAEIAHELRTPLSVLRGELEALEDGVRVLDSKAVRSLQDETRHLVRLVDDLHQLSLADLGALPCTMVRVDLGAIGQRVTDRYAKRAVEKGLVLHAAIGTGVMLEADPQRFEQLLTNLIENSIRYTDAPGRIEVALAADSAAVRLTVEDSAPGVAAADQQRLFEPLYRADAARSRRAGGSGLGLAICRAIVQAHHGTIRATDSRLGGLAICATFPRAI